ncbi:hypothetical protein [Prescottella equi]|uniref:hypothetical protein n=1 Tax=Rhodococcus hoagii TaxID=43767 RepID=UPI0007CD8C17|nr:hypothetical protein [Prescottella equi]
MTSTDAATGPATLDPEVADAIERAQRSYATEHGIELTENEFALAKAETLVNLERLSERPTAATMDSWACAGVRTVANQAGRRRPLSGFERAMLWLNPLVIAVVAGAGLWAARDLKNEVVTAEYPSWLPTDIAESVPGWMSWFGQGMVGVGAAMVIVAVVGSVWAAVRTQDFRTAKQLSSLALMVGCIVLLTLAVAATAIMVVMVDLGSGH